MTMLLHYFLVRMRVKMGDDAPALTVSQMRQLLQVVRLRMLGLLLVNVGADKAVRLGDPKVWREAIKSLKD